MPRRKKDEYLENLVDDEPPAIEPYTILGIEKTATAEEVKSAYRKAALKHHPGMLTILTFISRHNFSTSYVSFGIGCAASLCAWN